MKIDLSKLKENDLKKYSYEDTVKVIDELERISISRFSGIKAIETIEQYISFASIISCRIKENEFFNSSSESEIKSKNILERRVETILTNLQYAFYLTILSNRVNEAENVRAQAKELETKITNIENNYNEKEQKIDQYIADCDKIFLDYKKRIDEFESKILSHVLSIMGVFSAIITIILSLITTTSSWINNATDTDLFFAFIVPNGVAIVAVFALMILVYYFLDYHKNDKSDDDNGKQNDKPVDTKEEKKQSKKHKPVYIMLSVVVLISALLLSVYIATQNIKSPAHVRYIISSEQYEVREDTEKSPHKCPHNAECNCQTFQETKNYFEFTFEDKLYRFEYDESLKHGENLYFCEKHCTLE